MLYNVTPTWRMRTVKTQLVSQRWTHTDQLIDYGNSQSVCCGKHLVGVMKQCQLLIKTDFNRYQISIRNKNNVGSANNESHRASDFSLGVFQPNDAKRLLIKIPFLETYLKMWMSYQAHDSLTKVSCNFSLKWHSFKYLNHNEQRIFSFVTNRLEMTDSIFNYSFPQRLPKYIKNNLLH